MANSPAMCTSFKADLLNGVHAFSAVYRAADAFKAALYIAAAATPLGAATTVYRTADEVTGTGYTAGGVAVTFGTAPAVSGTSGIVTPSASIIFSNVTLTTAFDTVLLYNSSQSNKAVSVHTFGAQTITAGTLTLTMPANAPGTALIELA